MAMPEAPVDKDRSLVLPQDQIGFSALLLRVEPEAEPPRMQRLAAAGCPVVNVSQRVSGAEP